MIRSSVSEGSPTEGVGARLKRLRLQRGLSQRDLSSPGVSYAYISRIEAGARTPSVKALRKLSQKLKVSVEYLETGRDIRDVDDRELRLADAELELRLNGDAPGADEKLEQIRAEAVAAGDVASALRAQTTLGLLSAQRGNHLEAVERLEGVLSDDAAPPPHLRPDLYTTLGQSYAALGAPDRAVRVFDDCLARVREDVPDDTAVQIRYATFLSYALTDAREYERSAEVVREALTRADDQTDPYTRVRLYWSLARLNAVEGRQSDALEYIRAAIALLKATDDTLTLGRALSFGVRRRARPNAFWSSRNACWDHIPSRSMWACCASASRDSRRSNAGPRRRSSGPARRSPCSATFTAASKVPPSTPLPPASPWRATRPARAMHIAARSTS